MTYLSRVEAGFVPEICLAAQHLVQHGTKFEMRVPDFVSQIEK